MTRYVIALAAAVAAAVLLLPDGATAAPTGTACSAAGCFSPVGDLRVNDGAASDALEFEWCPGVAVTTMTSDQYLADAKSLYCQNRHGSATIYVTLDAASLTTTGSTGWKLAAGGERTWAIDGSNFGPNIKAAATAETSTGSCLWCSWLK